MEIMDARPVSADDYTNAHSTHNYDRGHLAPLGSFDGSRHASQVNFYSNIVPQIDDLNRGPWMRLEAAERGLVEKYFMVWVMTGPLYERPMPGLPRAGEQHTVPSGFWKIVTVDSSGSMFVAAFIMDQATPRNADYKDSLVTVNEVERRSGWRFFWKLPQNQQNTLKNQRMTQWVVRWD